MKNRQTSTSIKNKSFKKQKIDIRFKYKLILTIKYCIASFKNFAIISIEYKSNLLRI